MTSSDVAIDLTTTIPEPRPENDAISSTVERAFSTLAFDDQSLLGWLVYIGVIVLSVWLQRKIFLVFGAIGTYGWATYLVFETFDGALGILFGFAMVGLLIVLSGVGYRRSIEPMRVHIGQPSTI
jgi:hypothetical protein